MPKVHQPIACYRHRARAWKRRNFTHWRPEQDWDTTLKRRVVATLERHLARGGTVAEHGRFEIHTRWRLGSACFVAPYNQDPAFIADHITARCLGFGWPISLLP